ncbi:WbqC family protein [uncultured Dokdonia sp.]|uniref:WbqC family protein n=1 Tax=uncultured Dokdonia sp. TaxID=575653 RepID=UPI00261D07B0|nr:WbqC family protein [uncultured Dokdonia sp.]
MSKRLFVIQSNYIPWKGYFDAINSVDTVVIYDEMQYTKNDWRNRNIIKTQAGVQWLTIPVSFSGKFGQKINEAQISNDIWRKKHWKTIVQNYNKAPYFHLYKDIFEELYLRNSFSSYLTDINLLFIQTINEILGIETEIIRSKDLMLQGDKNERLIGVCKQLKITDYLSGPAAKSYMDEQAFADNQINVSYVDYSGYPEYNQLFEDFEHGVSILDLIFNTGEEAIHYMKSFKNET